MNQEEKRLIQDKYEIVSKIKQGGFGIVYKGYDHFFEKPVAIKAIEPGLLREAKYIDLFLEEAKNAGKLSHNNIVHIYNLVRENNGQFFIIMEYVDGVDLGKILKVCRKKKITIPKELSIFIVKEICKALEYAHNKRDVMTDKPLRLVHQDISPSNIMTSLSGNVKLIDFGLAKIRFQSNNSNEIVLSGKLPYMAPEQVNGIKIDRRTDIFSLGTVFYEMLTGFRLFPLDDASQTIDLIKKCKIDPSVLIKHEVPETLQQIVLKMLQRDPENRYQGANGVYLDLVECLMKMSSSVELSNELGKFVRHLIDSDVSLDDQSTVGDSTIDEGPPKPRIKEEQEIIPEKESIKEVPGSGKFDIKELKIEPNVLQEKMHAFLSKHGTDNKQKVVLSSDKTEIMKSSDSAGLGKKSSLFESSDGIPKEEPTVSDEEQEIANEVNIPFDTTIESKGETVVENGVIFPKSLDKVDKKSTTSHMVPSTLREEEGEDDLKTVIDVIRLSTKRHKKVITIAVASVMGVLVLFQIFDIMLQLTSLGEGIYNRLFPPAIRISSLPVGAAVYIDNQPINGNTPLSIPKISPGVHELKLTFPGYSPLIKSIHVPSKGEVKVTGEQVRKGYDPYLFRFKSQIDITSDPSGATIYINQLLYPQKTPTTIEWETGSPLSIEMEQANFQKLSGFTLNTLDGIEEIEDRRLWSFDTIEGEAKRYIVEGIFKKFVILSCVPSGVNFYIDDSPTPSGRTDVSSTIALTMGTHKISFQKDGFNSRTINLTVDKNGPESISVMLTRNIRFFAKDKNDPGNNEIGARIVRIIQNNKSYLRNDRTPCELSLPPINLQVVFAKEGYNEAIVNVSERDKDVVVKMEQSSAIVEILVTDALTNLPLKDVQISYRSVVNDQAGEVFFGATDENGKCTNKLAPGEYNLRAKKVGYFEKYTVLNSKSGDNKLEFKLILQ